MGYPVPQVAFYSGELMEPIGIRSAFPAAMFIARGWVAPDASLSEHFASVAGDQIWGIAVGLGEEVDGDLVTVEQPNSIAMRMTMVACDRADLVATLRWGNEWDIGAAALIAREAGAAVTDAFGQPLAYNKPDPRAFGVLASSPLIHGAAVERLAGRAKELAGN